MTIWKDRLEWPSVEYDDDGEMNTPDESGAHFECNGAGYASPDSRVCRAMEQQISHNWGPPVFADTGFGPVGDNEASTIKCECS